MPEFMRNAPGETLDALGDSAVGRRIAQPDFTDVLGPVACWPQALRIAVGLMLRAETQIVLFWGPDYIALYNDAYAPTIGDKHPGALGRPARENWAELWDDLEPLLRGVRDTGRTFSAKDRPFYLERHGYGEEVYFDVSYSAVIDDDGSVGGVLCIVSETTPRVRGERRLRFQVALADRLRGVLDPAEIKTAASEMIGRTLGVGRAGYAEIDEAQAHFTVATDWTVDGMPSLAGAYALADFGPGVIEAYRAGRTLVIDDSGKDAVAEGFREAFAAIKVVAGVAVPLVKEGRCVAVLYVHSAKPRRWSDTEVLLVEETAERTWAAVEQAKAEAALREESRALEVLANTAAHVAAEFDLDKLVKTVVDAGVELTGAAFGAFFYNVVDHRGESYALYVLSGVDRVAFDKFPQPRITKLFAPTFGGEGLVRSDDITQDPRYGQNAPHKGQPDGHLPVRSYLAAPVVSRGGGVIGGLFFGDERAGVFTERAERLLEGLAAQAAIGIDNARLFQASQRLNETLEAQVAQRTAERDRIWQASGDLLGVAGLDGAWRSVNPAWTRVLGWMPDDILGRTSEWLEHPDDREKTRAEVAQLASGAAALAFENRLRTRTGDYRVLSWTAVPVEDAIYCVARDVTAEKDRQRELAETQERLRQSQKMETVGQLTGGVAHDFNNLLQIVSGNLDILLRTLPEDAPRQRRAVESAMSGAKRAATLTQRLLAFARRQPLAPKPIDPNKLIAGMSELLHRSLGETIEIETVRSPNLWRVEADPNALENAILNLALNARDAMPSGGKLTIETANTHLDRAYVAQHVELNTGQYVSISVSDTGAGMPPDVVERVFEPFFTTKEVGKGTGLGLSMVYGFVKQSGGHVKIYSEVGQGATVRLYLPRLTGPEEDEDDGQGSRALERAREETVLVCEDDDDVRAYSVEVLRELGYRVLEAHDGPSALRLLERQDGPVDLLFTDVVLPSGMTGAIVADKARALRPGLKVLFTTGYARNAIVHHGRLDPGVELITKPFSYADLAVRIRDVLDGPGAA